MPDGFCLFCRRRNLFVAELPGIYRQVGDVLLLKFFVVEGGRAGLKKMPLAVGDRDVLIPEASLDFFARSASAKFLVAESFSVSMSVWENPHADISMLQFYFRNWKSQ